MDGTVGNGVTLDNVKLTDSTVEDGADAGPFVQIRGGSVLHTGVPVSYTHLDVYKRQTLRNGQAPGPDERDVCRTGRELLY